MEIENLIISSQGLIILMVTLLTLIGIFRKDDIIKAINTYRGIEEKK